MLSPVLAHILLATIVAVSVAMMLIRPRSVPEVYWIGGGVLLLLGLRLITLRLALHASGKALDVCFFLVGMMLLCETGSRARRLRLAFSHCGKKGRRVLSEAVYPGLCSWHGGDGVSVQMTQLPSF